MDINREDDYNSSLAIPLEDFSKILLEDSKVKGEDIKSSIIGTVIFVFSARYGIGIEAFFMLPIVLWICFSVMMRIKGAKRVLRFYAQAHNAPILTLDLKGINCPTILLPYSSNGSKSLMDSGEESFQVNWQDIEKLTVLPIPYPFFRFKLKKGCITPESDTVDIRRAFSEEKEQDIINFVQRFLSSPIKSISAVQKKAPWYKARKDVIILVLIALFAILLFKLV